MLKPKGLGQDTLIGLSCESISSYAARRSHLHFHCHFHLVFECAAMADLRGQFPDIFQPDDAAIHVAAKSVAGCQILRCRHEKIADG